MKAMVLAAGRGERMRPLSDRMPKPLLDLCGRPIIAWTIERLVRAGFPELVINHAHLGALIESTLGDGSRFGATIIYSAEPEALETAGGIVRAMGALGDEPFVVVNGDIYCEFDYGALRARPLGPALAHLVLTRNPEYHPAGDFALDGAQVRDEGAKRYTFSGIGLYRPALFESVRPGEKAKLAPLLRAAMAHGLVTGELSAAVWHDLGTPERLERVRRELDGRALDSPFKAAENPQSL